MERARGFCHPRWSEKIFLRGLNVSLPRATHVLSVAWWKHSPSQYLLYSCKNSFSKIFVRISFLKRFIEVEALLGLSKALIRFI